MSPEERKRLEELVKQKAVKKLSDSEYAEYKKLKSMDKGKRKKSDPKSDHFDPGNDFSWWSKIPELVRDCASFKSNYVAGRAIDSNRIPYVVPGVLEVKLLTCYDSGSTATDAINVWARNNYLKMFQKYRPASGYSASDQGIAIIAGLEAVKLIAIYERIYGVINRYSVLNVNMPNVEAEALGLGSSQLQYLQTHMSDFRYDLNFLIRKAQRLCIPKDIALIADSISLLGFEYIDHANPRGQIIVFTLDNYGVYSDTAMSTGGSIHYYPDLPLDLFDFSLDNMCKALDIVLAALLGSDSIQRIFADLVVWFGQDAMLSFLPMPEDFIITPTESKSILHKLHNLELMPAPLRTGSQNPYFRRLCSWAVNGLTTADETAVLSGDYMVYQYLDNIVTVGTVKDTNTGTPTSCPYNGRPGKVLEGTSDIYSMGTAHVIDGYDIDVTPEFIVEGSLLKYVAKPVSSTDHKAVVIQSCVDWLVQEVKLHANSAGYPSTSLSMWHPGSAGAMDAAARLALVDWAPLTYVIAYNGSDTDVLEIYGDLDVIIPVSAGDLERVQRTCFLSALTTEVSVKQ